MKNLTRNFTPSEGMNFYPEMSENCFNLVYREICPKDCPSQMCYQSDNKTHCCDEECAAGCFGEGKSACIVRRYYFV